MDYARSKCSCLSATERRSTAADRASVVCGFSRIKKFYAELRRELVTKSTSGGCDQFDTSPEAIDQELRTAFCERRQTDLRQIIG